MVHFKGQRGEQGGQGPEHRRPRNTPVWGTIAGIAGHIRDWCARQIQSAPERRKPQTLGQHKQDITASAGHPPLMRSLSTLPAAFDDAVLERCVTNGQHPHAFLLHGARSEIPFGVSSHKESDDFSRANDFLRRCAELRGIYGLLQFTLENSSVIDLGGNAQTSKLYNLACKNGAREYHDVSLEQRVENLQFSPHARAAEGVASPAPYLFHSSEALQFLRHMPSDSGSIFSFGFLHHVVLSDGRFQGARVEEYLAGANAQRLEYFDAYAASLPPVEDFLDHGKGQSLDRSLGLPSHCFQQERDRILSEAFESGRYRALANEYARHATDYLIYLIREMHRVAAPKKLCVVECHMGHLFHRIASSLFSSVTMLKRDRFPMHDQLFLLLK